MYLQESSLIQFANVCVWVSDYLTLFIYDFM